MTKKTGENAGAPATDEMKALLAKPLQVGRYEVRPWTLREFDAVYPKITPIVSKLMAAGMSLDNLEKFVRGQFLSMLPALMPDIRPLLAVSLKVPLEEIEALDWGTGAALAIAVIRQNLEPLKNLLALIPQITMEIRASTP